jgi:hypothetical protein
MVRLKNVTVDEFKDAEARAFEVSQVIADLHRRAEQGYADPVPNPLELASSFASISRTLAELSAYFLMKAGLDEQRRLIEAQLQKRDN